MLSIVQGLVAALAVATVLAVLAAWWFSSMVAKKAAAALPAKGRFTDVPGGRVHWVEQGEGPPIVMIHGLAGSLHNFTYAMQARLAAAGYRAIAVDRPGCGWSERDGDARARIPEQARMIAAMLAREGIERPLLVGHSLGGAVSLALAENHPEQVGGVALVAALVSVPDAPSAAFAGINIPNPFIRRLVAHTLAVPMSIRNGEKTLAILFGPDPAPEDFRTRGGGLLSLRPQAFYAAATDLDAVPQDMPDITARIGEIRVPVGMIYGTGDRILSARDQIAVLSRALPDAEIVTLEGHGHMIPVVADEAVEAFVLRMAVKAAG